MKHHDHRSVTVKVTQADIDAAVRERGTISTTRCCAVAQALKRLFPNEGISVEYFSAYVGYETYVPADTDSAKLMASLTFVPSMAWPNGLSSATFELRKEGASE